jgi:iron complex outermembrane receptor protein
VPDGQLATGGYTLWNTALTYRVRTGASQLLWYARLDNLGDTLAYSASSILTQTAPGRAPLPGRSLKAGLQLTF